MGGRGLWTLVPLCIVWTNLHQGVLSLVGILIAYAAGDMAAAVWTRTDALPPRFYWKCAWRMLAAAIGCALAVTVSPHG